MARATRDEEFSEYVEQRRTQLRRIAYLLCGDVHKAEDLVQTALMKLYVAWHRERNVALRPGWKRLDPVVAEGLATEDRQALMEALATLPPGQRKVVVLRYFLDLSVEETATDLHCSVGTVKSQSSRALPRLNDLLTAQFRAVGGQNR